MGKMLPELALDAGLEKLPQLSELNNANTARMLAKELETTDIAKCSLLLFEKFTRSIDNHFMSNPHKGSYEMTLKDFKFKMKFKDLFNDLRWEVSCLGSELYKFMYLWTNIIQRNIDDSTGKFKFEVLNDHFKKLFDGISAKGFIVSFTSSINNPENVMVIITPDVSMLSE